MNNSNNSSTILVAGATGFLGSEVCRQLIERNRKVKGLVRVSSDANKLAQLRESGVQTAVGDLKDKASLEKALQGVSAVISTISSTLSRQEGDSIQTVDDEGQINLIDASLSLFRFVLCRVIFRCRQLNAKWKNTLRKAVCIIPFCNLLVLWKYGLVPHWVLITPTQKRQYMGKEKAVFRG